jgi:uncharacterized Fe-S cluster-containing MiaB family protein
METKFCIVKTEEHLKVEIQGNGAELMALLATVISEDPRIKRLVMESVVAAILDEKIEAPNDPLKDMLSKMNIGIA